MAWDDDSLIYNHTSGDYTKANDWAAAIDDITPTGDGFRGRIRGLTADDADIAFDGMQSGMSSSCKIVLTAETGYGLQDRTNWKGGDGSGDDARLPAQQIKIDEDTNAIYMDIYNFETAGAIRFISESGTCVVRIWNLFHNGDSHFILTALQSTTTVYVGNVLSRGYVNSTYRFMAPSQSDFSIYVRHCTDDGGDNANFGYDYGSAAACECRNCVGINYADTAWDNSIDEDYCAADDASANNTNDQASINPDNNFNDVSNDDYTVKNGADIYQAGGSSAPSWFTDMVGSGANGEGTDIVGNDYASSPSIGCFEYYWDKDSLVYNDASGDYTKLSDWEAAVDDITPVGVGFRARIRGLPADTAILVIAGMQSGQSSSCRMHITAEDGYGLTDRVNWTGAVGSGDDAVIQKAITIYMDSYATFLDVYNVELDGAQVYPYGDYVGQQYQIYNAFFHDIPGGMAIQMGTVGTTVLRCANLLFRNCYRSIYNTDTDSTLYARHITIDGEDTAYRGIQTASQSNVIRNCVSFGTDYDFLTDNEQYCASEDSSANGTGCEASITVANNITDPDNDDFTIKDSDADIYHSGEGSAPSWFTDLVGSGNNSEGTDITGRSYHSTPSMGCFEGWANDSLIYNDVAGDYTKLGDWEAVIDDLVPSGPGFRARIRGTTADVSPSIVTVGGIQSGLSDLCRVCITAETGYGLSDRSDWHGEDGSGSDAICPVEIRFDEDTQAIYGDVYNIEIYGGYTAAACLSTWGNSTEQVYHFYNLFIRDSGTGDKGLYCYVNVVGSINYLANILVRDANANELDCRGDTITYARHITVRSANNTNAIFGSGDGFEIRNSVAYNSASEDYYSSPNLDEQYCASEDTSISGTGCITGITKADEFTDESADDFSIKDTDAEIYQSGIGSAPSWFTNLVGLGANDEGTDIIGNDYASSPSMGCFEYVSGATPLAPTISDSAKSEWTLLP